MRAILIGDNQFELHRNLEDVLRSMERPGAASGDYWVFDESGQRYEFVVDRNDHSQVGSFELIKVFDNGLPELFKYYSDWIDYNELEDMPDPGPNLFDELEVMWGLR